MSNDYTIFSEIVYRRISKNRGKLSYIKLGLGAPLNLVEISDSDLIEFLREHVLPVFSQFNPLKRWVYMGPENQIVDGAKGQPMYRFKIPKPTDEPIVDVLEVIFGPYSIKKNTTQYAV